MTREDVPVLIAGGSLVGLSTSLFLAAHGVEALAVERHPGTAIHPRAALFNQRTIELFRQVGIEDEIKAAADLEFVQNGAIMSVESLGGKELEWYFRNVNEGVEHLSPSPRIFITQIGLEPVLKARAAELGARLEYSTELVSFEQDGNGVTALLRTRDGDERTVRARYLVAADGVRSPVRERLGIGTRGHGSFSNSITIYFRADVRELIGDRNLSVIYVFHPRQQGFFRFSKAGDAGFLVVNTTLHANGERNRDVWGDTSDERCVAYVREALGAPDDLPIEIENVQRWNASAEWAERLRAGRVFLAGDAAHAMPPTGGFGGNTGVADASNLAWKLAAVLDGSAGEALLDTYEAERLPVAELTCEQAYTRYVLRLDPELGKEDIQPFVPDPPIELGHLYHSAAVIEEEGADGALYEDPSEPSCRPGSRAPHVDLGGGRSTIDLFGRHFVLISPSERWCAASPVEAHRLEVYGLEPDGAVLVRPDGFIAWRSSDFRPDALDGALARVLAR